MSDDVDQDASRPPGRLARFLRQAWWLHSFWALALGVGVMFFARKGIAHADKILVVAGVAWLLVFVAVRFITGPGNTSSDEPRSKVLRSQLTTLPADPLGAWSCSLETTEDQIIGRVAWTVEPPAAAPAAH